MLHVFLLDDADVIGMGQWLRGRLPAWWGESEPAAPAPRSASRAPRRLALAACGLYMVLSAAGAVLHFVRDRGLQEAADLVYGPFEPLRVVNVYHLFAQITRERIEPEFQAHVDDHWIPQHLRFKPGAPWKPPPFVAPHQPRVDFRLWFYGLSWERGMPRFVQGLLERMCTDPASVAQLFDAPLPGAPDSVRVVFRRYAMTDFDERRREGRYWRTAQVGALPALPCPPRVEPEI